VDGCKGGGGGSRDWRLQDWDSWTEVGGEEPKITSQTRNKIIRIIPFFRKKEK
jgi:hypothetical protein